MNANHGSTAPRRVLLLAGNSGESARVAAMLHEAFGATCEVSHATRLADGVDALTTGWFDVVVLDLVLPDAQGPRSVARLNAACAETAIVAISGLGDEVLGVEAIRVGAQDVLRKDALDASWLRRTIRHALERQRILNRLARADRVKTRFVATAAHELRSPLAVIRGYVEAVRDELLGAIGEKPRQWLTSALSGCDRLAELIGSILDLGQIERGQLAVRARRTEIEPLLRSCREEFASACEALQLTLTLECGEPLPPVLGDEARLRQVLVNLIGNATKFTPPGGHIAIHAKSTGDTISITVADSGIGIAREDQRAIFQEFTKIDNPPGGASPGSGLGLSITKHIIERHHGAIRVESAPGAGTRFSFEIPTYEAGRELDAFLGEKRRAFGSNRHCFVHVRGNEVELSRLADAVRLQLRNADDAFLCQPERGRAVIAFDCPREIIHRPLDRLLRALGSNAQSGLGFAIESSTGPVTVDAVVEARLDGDATWPES